MLLTSLLTVAGLVGALLIAPSAGAEGNGPSVLCRVWAAAPGDTLELSESMTASAGSITREGDSCESGRMLVDDATITLGNGIATGSGITAEITPTSMVVTEGTFTVNPAIFPGTLVIDRSVNNGTLTAEADGAGLRITAGRLIPEAPAAAAGAGAGGAAPKSLHPSKLAAAAAAAVAAQQVNPDDILPDILQALLGGDIVVWLDFTEWGIGVNFAVHPYFRLWGVLALDGSYRFNVEIKDLPIGDPELGQGKVNGTGTISGASLEVEPTVNITGSITGPLGLTPDIALLSGNATITNTGIQVGGQIRVNCLTGTLTLGAALDYRGETEWSAAVNGGVGTGGCTLAEGLVLNSGSVAGNLRSTDTGEAEGDLTVNGSATIAGLPEGLQDWTIRVQGAFSPAPAGGSALTGEVEITSDAAGFTGSVTRDGRFSLSGYANISALGANVRVEGGISGAIDSPDFELNGAVDATFPIKVPAPPAAPAPARNLARDAGTTATQATTEAGFPASNAIDGNSQGNFGTAAGAMSQLPTTSTSVGSLSTSWASNAAAIGGSGGNAVGPFNCPAGQVLTGVNYWENPNSSSIDSNGFQGRCSAVGLSGSTVTFSYMGNAPVMGYASGNVYTRNCAAGSAVVGLDAQLTSWPTIDWLRLRCAPFTFNGTSFVRGAITEVSGLGIADNQGGIFIDNRDCGTNQLVGGYAGRVGGALDQIVLRCFAMAANSTTTTTRNGVRDWWQVDLGAVREIDSLDVFGRTDAPWDTTLFNAYVFVSDTPFTSNNPVTVAGTAGVTTYRMGSTARSQSFTVGGTGRFIRIQNPNTNDNDELAIAEVRVNGRNITAATPTEVDGTARLTGSVKLNQNGLSLNGSLTVPCGDGNAVFSLNAPIINGESVDISAGGRIDGRCVIGGVTIDGANLSGRITLIDGIARFSGELAIRIGDTSVAGSISFGPEGFGLAGTLSLPCLTGDITVDLATAVAADGVDATVTGKVGPAGCELTPGLALKAGQAINGTLSGNADGVSASFDASGSIRADWLPGGATDWNIAAAITASANGTAKARIALTSGVGGFAGDVNSDGTFNLSGFVNVTHNGTTVKLNGSLVRSTPNGDPVLNASASVDNTTSGVRIAGSITWNANGLRLTGTATVSCNPGTITGSINLPIDRNGNWSATVGATVASGGCRLNPDVLLNSANFTGTLSSTNGKIGLSLNGNASITTRSGLVPYTGNTFTGSFGLTAANGTISGNVSLSGGGVSLSGAINWAGDMNWSVSASGKLQVRGSTLGFSGRITRTSSGLSWDLSGSVSGAIQLAENLWLQSGSFRWNNSNFSFNGQIRVLCTSGDMYISAGGWIASGNNWRFETNATANNCRLGRNFLLSNNPFSGYISSSNGTINAEFQASFSRWDPIADVWITNGSLWLRITDGWRFQGRIQATGGVRIWVLFVAKEMSATVTAEFDLSNRWSGNVRVTLSNIWIGWLSVLYQPSLEVKLRDGTIYGISI